MAGKAYRVSKRQCWYSAPHRQPARFRSDIDFTAKVPHRGTPILWPDFVFRGNSTPICCAHAMHYYGADYVTKLVQMGHIKAWSTEMIANILGKGTPTQSVLGGADSAEWKEI